MLRLVFGYITRTFSSGSKRFSDLQSVNFPWFSWVDIGKDPFSDKT